MTDAIDRALSIAADLRKAEKRVDRNPSDAAKEAGNYRKGHLNFHGLDVTVENPKGSERSGVSPNGKRWSVRMPAAYGYVKGTEGHDGDHVDVYLGPDHASDKVYVVDQIDAKTGKYDEHKCLLSFGSKSEALAAYEKAFSDGRAKDRIGAVTAMTFDKFKDWVKSGDTKSPLGNIERKSYATGGAVMPLIKGSSRNAVSENIKTEIASGKKRDQAIAIALDVARRAKRASGGGVDEDDMPSLPRVMDPTDRVLDGGILEPMNSRERARVGRKAMYGRDPVLTPEDRAEIAGRMPAYEETARNVEQGIGSLATEATGVPSMYRGAQGVSRGIDEGDPLRAFAGASEFALGALPMAGAARAGRAAIAPFVETAPRAAATFGALTAPSAIVSNADARDRSAAEAVLNDATVKALKAERDKVVMDMTRVNEANKKSGRITHETAVMPFKTRLSVLDGTPDKPGLIAQAEEDARKRYIENAPFRERYPGVAGTMMGVGAGYAAGVPLVKEVLKRGADRFVKAPAVEAAADDFAGLVGRNKTSDAALAQQGLRNKLDAWDRSHGPVATTADAVGNVAKGAVAMTEASAIPEQVDYFNYEPGHESHDRAAKLFRDPEYWGERAGPAVFGGALGLTGQAIGKVGARKYDFADERAMADMGGRGTPRDRFMEGLGLEDRSAKNVERLRAYETETSPKALRDKDRQKRLGDESRQIGGAKTLEAEAAALEAAAGTGPKGSPSAAAEVGPATGAQTDDLVARIRRNRELGDRLLADEAAANPVAAGAKTKKASTALLDNPTPTKRQAPLNQKGHTAMSSVTDDLLDRGILPADFTPAMYLDKMSNVKTPVGAIEQRIDELRRVQYALEDAGIKDPSAEQIKKAYSYFREKGIQALPKRAMGGEVDAREHHSHFQPRKIGRFAGGPVYEPIKQDGTTKRAMTSERRAKGVDVDQALNVARKYAHGGAVHAGPVPGETTGRSDKLPIDVEAGSFVIPADIVAALGDGNSEAGYVHLNKVFGAATPRLARGGTAVPIKISHGEYVVPPETVARIGKGDMDMGHRSLDKFVLGVRKQNIHKLSKLPPPAR